MKNAFNLQLIDCMSEMLRKKDPEMNNFQAASCTLDASTKIYAYRVDCVHIDTLKMAGGLGRTGNEEHQEQDNAQTNEGETENASKKRARVTESFFMNILIEFTKILWIFRKRTRKLLKQISNP